MCFSNRSPFFKMFSSAYLPISKQIQVSHFSPCFPPCFPRRCSLTQPPAVLDRRLLQGLLGQRRAAALELHEVTEGVAVADHRGQFAQEVGHLRRSVGHSWVLPGLVNSHKKRWKDPPFFMGKSTISTGPCSIAMLVYQRVNVDTING